MNNGMPNNFNNSNGASDPLAAAAASDLMGGQSSANQNINPMSGVENVIPTPTAFQGLRNVHNNSNIMQGDTGVQGTASDDVIPGQGHSGINAFTMQGEPASEPTISNNIEVPRQDPVNQINNTFNSLNQMNNQLDNNSTVGVMPDLNTNLSSGVVNIPNVNSEVNSTFEPINESPAMPEAQPNVMPQGFPSREETSVEQAMPQMDNGPVMGSGVIMPETNVFDTSFNNPVNPVNNNMMNNQSPTPEMQEQVNMGPQPMDPMNNNMMNNQFPAPEMQGQVNMGPQPMDNQIGNADMNMIGNQIGNNVPEQYNNESESLSYQPNEKKFPLSTREVVAVSLALISIIFFICMYGFGWFK